mmetsp:Transcript_53993/g.123046  ORF Transcript_53993/g.123046 Transcript_53993/m.123046 type:complete len:202 (-) Transcript_53993:959-1564(-)
MALSFSSFRATSCSVSFVTLSSLACGGGGGEGAFFFLDSMKASILAFMAASFADRSRPAPPSSSLIEGTPAPGTGGAAPKAPPPPFLGGGAAASETVLVANGRSLVTKTASAAPAQTSLTPGPRSNTFLFTTARPSPRPSAPPPWATEVTEVTRPTTALLGSPSRIRPAPGWTLLSMSSRPTRALRTASKFPTLARISCPR